VLNDLFAGIPVTDIAAARDFYGRLFGAGPEFDPHERESVWRAAGGWVYVVEDRQRAGNGLVTILVDDLPAQLGELRGRGIAPEGIEMLGSGTRKALVVDPDGNRISFGQPPSED
jgi:catechol 2,3-dioxygenase-like lactoylglutathione lyase family enzyme